MILLNTLIPSSIKGSFSITPPICQVNRTMSLRWQNGFIFQWALLIAIVSQCKKKCWRRLCQEVQSHHGLQRSCNHPNSYRYLNSLFLRPLPPITVRKGLWLLGTSGSIRIRRMTLAEDIRSKYLPFLDIFYWPKPRVLNQLPKGNIFKYNNS